MGEAEAEILKKWEILARQNKQDLNYLQNNRKINFKSYDSWKKMVPKYQKKIDVHINTYKSEFTKYFSENAPEKKNLIAFDVEEVHNNLSLIMTIILKPDLSYYIRMDVINRYPSEGTSNHLLKVYQRFLEEQDPGIVLIHGDNKKEKEIISKTHHGFANTQTLLSEMRDQKILPLTSVGLSAFEKAIGFERIGCKTLKHMDDVPKKSRGKFIRNFFNETLLAIHDLNSGFEFQPCIFCGKPNDIFFYCLEDSFSTLLAYAYSKNRLEEEEK